MKESSDQSEKGTVHCPNCGHEMVYNESPYHGWYLCKFEHCPVGRHSGPVSSDPGDVESGYRTISCEECGAKYAPEIARGSCPVCEHSTAKSRMLTDWKITAFARKASENIEGVDLRYDPEGKQLVVSA